MPGRIIRPYTRVHFQQSPYAGSRKKTFTDAALLIDGRKEGAGKKQQYAFMYYKGMLYPEQT
jgi:hypothetical protein